jgi:hypothetical protein
MVKNFETEARNKIGLQLVEHTTDMLLCANIFFRRMQNNDRQYRELSLMIESYILYRLYDKIFLGLRILYEAEDTVINKVINQINSSENNTRSYLGINTEFIDLPFGMAISKLDSLTECKTPLQMIYLLEDVVEQGIISVAETHRNKKNSKSKTQQPITPADLLPMLALAICGSSYKYFNSTLFYVENFIFADISTTKLAFILINFRAALAFLMEQTPEVSLDQSSRHRSLIISNATSLHPINNNNLNSTHPNSIKISSTIEIEPRTSLTSKTQQNLSNKSPLIQRPPDVIKINNLLVM